MNLRGISGTSFKFRISIGTSPASPNIGKAVGVQLTLKGPKIIIIMVELLTEFSSTLAQQEAGRAQPEAGRAP